MIMAPIRRQLHRVLLLKGLTGGGQCGKETLFSPQQAVSNDAPLGRIMVSVWHTKEFPTPMYY